MKFTLLLLIILLITGFLSYFTILFLQRDGDKTPWKKKFLVIVSILLLVLTQLPLLRSLLGYYTMTIVIHNGYTRNVLPIELNGKEATLKPSQLAFFNTAKYRNRLVIKFQGQTIDTLLRTGFYVASWGGDNYLDLIEKQYSSFSGDYTNKDKQLFNESISNTVIKLDSDPENCIINPPGWRIPRVIDARYKGKRIFESVYRRQNY